MNHKQYMHTYTFLISFSLVKIVLELGHFLPHLLPRKEPLPTLFMCIDVSLVFSVSDCVFCSCVWVWSKANLSPQEHPRPRRHGWLVIRGGRKRRKLESQLHREVQPAQQQMGRGVLHVYTTQQRGRGSAGAAELPATLLAHPVRLLHQPLTRGHRLADRSLRCYNPDWLWEETQLLGVRGERDGETGKGTRTGAEEWMDGEARGKKEGGCDVRLLAWLIYMVPYRITTTLDKDWQPRL